MITSNLLSGHYSYALNPLVLSEIAERRAKQIKETVVTNKVPVLVFTGFSGIALATAIALELTKLKFSFHMLMVRKQGEADQCHGDTVQCSLSRLTKDCCFIFVDDFVDSGKTLARMNTTVSKFGGIKYVCTNSDLDTINPYTSCILSDQDQAYYSSLIIEVNVE